MTPTTYHAAPMAAYVSLTLEGDALYRFVRLGPLTVSNARLLAAKNWLEPDPVRIATPDGRRVLFGFAVLTSLGRRIWHEQQIWMAENTFEWGTTWNVREDMMARHSPPDEPKMVHPRSLIRLMDETNIDVCYDESANDWWQGDLASRDVEDIVLPHQ